MEWGCREQQQSRERERVMDLLRTQAALGQVDDFDGLLLTAEFMLSQPHLRKATLQAQRGGGRVKGPTG